MANTTLTPTIITREALRVLHQKLTFLGNVNTQYDPRFASSGGKIGNTLNVRMPAKYTTSKSAITNLQSNASASYQDYVERSTPIVVASQYHVDVSFTDAELTLGIDDFSERILSPAMSQLAASMEADALTAAYKLVANYAGDYSGAMTYKSFQQNGQKITENLGTLSGRTALLNPQSTVDFADATKGLFQDSSEIQKHYREGRMGRTGGFDVYESTLIPSHTVGSQAGTCLTTGTGNATTTTATTWVSQTDVSVTGATATTTFKAGDIITIGTLADGMVDCHPESKASYGRLKTFVVQSDLTMTTATSTYTVTVKPGIMVGSGNAYQNAIMTGADTSGMTVTNWAAASSTVGQSLFFHKDAFAFVTADLEDVSKYSSWGSRAQMDGISMRVGRQWDIANDRFPCRIDVLWGFAGLYPEMASRHIHKVV